MPFVSSTKKDSYQSVSSWHSSNFSLHIGEVCHRKQAEMSVIYAHFGFVYFLLLYESKRVMSFPFYYDLVRGEKNPFHFDEGSGTLEM